MSTKTTNTRAFAASLLSEEWFEALEPSLRWAYVALTQVCGPAGIASDCIEAWRRVSGFTSEWETTLMERLEAKGLIVRERGVVWVVDYWLYNPYVTPDSDNHRVSVQKFINSKLPKMRLSNDFATYYGLVLPSPELGTSGRFRTCARVEAYLAEKLGPTKPRRLPVGADGFATKTFLEGEMKPYEIETHTRRYLAIGGAYGDVTDRAREYAAIAQLAVHHSPPQIIELAEGLAMMRDDALLTSARPGEPVSLWMLLEASGALIGRVREYRVLKRAGASPEDITREMAALAQTEPA